MNRGIWFAAGVASGVYGVIRARRAAEALTADGVRDRAQALAHGARLLRDEVVAGATERETELRPRFGLGSADDPDGPDRPRRLAAAHEAHEAMRLDITTRKEH